MNKWWYWTRNSMVRTARTWRTNWRSRSTNWTRKWSNWRRPSIAGTMLASYSSTHVIRSRTRRPSGMKSSALTWSKSWPTVTILFKSFRTECLNWIDRDPQKVLPATECINNLISCHENLEKTKQLLKNVKLPFCTAEDMSLIIRLTDSIYEDMKSPEQQESTRESIGALKKSCVSLKLWFDNVIKETLMKPYSQTVHDHSRLTTELRNERIKLLTEKIREEFGKDVDLGTLGMKANMSSFFFELEPFVWIYLLHEN